MSAGGGTSHVAEKVEDLAASLQATTEVLSTADRMLEHYRDINVEQDEEIEKVRSKTTATNTIAKVTNTVTSAFSKRF